MISSTSSWENPFVFRKVNTSTTKQRDTQNTRNLFQRKRSQETSTHTLCLVYFRVMNVFYSKLCEESFLSETFFFKAPIFQNISWELKLRNLNMQQNICLYIWGVGFLGGYFWHLVPHFPIKSCSIPTSKHFFVVLWSVEPTLVIFHRIFLKFSCFLFKLFSFTSRRVSGNFSNFSWIKTYPRPQISFLFFRNWNESKSRKFLGRHYF